MLKFIKRMLCFMSLFSLICVTGCAMKSTNVKKEETSIEYPYKEQSENQDKSQNESKNESKNESQNESQDESQGAKLIVYGHDITKGNYVKLHNDLYYAELPFVAIITTLGVDLYWKNEYVAEFMLDGTKYILDINKCSLISEKSGINMISPCPGGIRYYSVKEQELIIDNYTLRYFFDMLGVIIDVDYDENIVNIY